MGGVAGDNFLRILETRLDNVVYRMGFAATRAEARQLVAHKAIEVNGDAVNVPRQRGAQRDGVRGVAARALLFDVRRGDVEGAIREFKKATREVEEDVASEVKKLDPNQEQKKG